MLETSIAFNNGSTDEATEALLREVMPDLSPYDMLQLVRALEDLYTDRNGSAYDRGHDSGYEDGHNNGWSERDESYDSDLSGAIDEVKLNYHSRGFQAGVESVVTLGARRTLDKEETNKEE